MSAEMASHWLSAFFIIVTGVNLFVLALNLKLYTEIVKMRDKERR